MNPKVAELQALVDQRREKLAGASDCDRLEQDLKAEQQKLRLELGDISLKDLAFPEPDAEQSNTPTYRKIRLLQDLGIKLDLIPGVRVRFQAEASGLGVRIQQVLKLLMRESRSQAEAKMKELETRTIAAVLGDCGGDEDQAKAAAAAVVEKSDAYRWREQFQWYNRSQDPEQSARDAIDLVEAFEAGEPCP